MALSESLVYIPKWHEVGDADNPWIAVAYGLIALAMIWVLESLAESLLFSDNQDISLSEVAAMVAFKGSTWFEIFGWLSIRKQQKNDSSGGYKLPAFNNKALLGVLLRFFLLAADIVIIFAFIPRSILVDEAAVGSSEMSFLSSGRRLIGFMDDQGSLDTPCFCDRLQYKGFFPTAVRAVCAQNDSQFEWSKRILELKQRENTQRSKITSLSERFSQKKLSSRHSDILKVYYNNVTYSLFLESSRLKSRYSFHHTINLAAHGQKPASHSRSFSLPLHPNIVGQSIQVVEGIPEQFGKCRKLHSKTDNPLRFLCVPRSGLKHRLFFAHMRKWFFLSMSSRKALHSAKKFNFFTGSIEHSASPIGVVSRPRLCIFPALILLGLFVLLKVVVGCFHGREQVAHKLFILACGEAGKPVTECPIRAEPGGIKEIVSRYRETDYPYK